MAVVYLAYDLRHDRPVALKVLRPEVASALGPERFDHGGIRERKKRPSRKPRDAFGHTPLSMEEEVPWRCRRLIIGTGTGALPVMEEVRHEARRRDVELVILPTARAIDLLKEQPADTNAILHVAC